MNSINDKLEHEYRSSSCTHITATLVYP